MTKEKQLLTLLEKEIDTLSLNLDFQEKGFVLSSGDGIATVYGLEKAMLGEILLFENHQKGLVLSLEENSIGVVLLDSSKTPSEGSFVERSFQLFQVPVGKALAGRVVNVLGEPLDNQGEIICHEFRDVEVKAPGVMSRKSIHEPLRTGIIAIDAMMPIGRGQRELIIGDRKTGKTSIALDAILAQKNENVYCFYVAIGQKRSTIRQIYEKLKQQGALSYTTIVIASSSEAAALQFLAPYSACTMAEYFRDKNEHALIVYDDLNKHAQSYRELSLVLKRPPGREAFPGDIFYLHSRLLERSCKLDSGGSLTALPIVETQEGDVSAYIPTNVISITDGQIYLESDLFYSGVKPAINVGLSVSRVGGSAQIKIMRQVSSSLRIALAQYRELAVFAQFGSDLDESTKKFLARGQRLVEILKQDEMKPYSFFEQIILLCLAQEGFFDDINLIDVTEKKKSVLLKFATQGVELKDLLADSKDFSKHLKEKIVNFFHG
jgi:F-type H+-transporting ATPase subunit alpha